MQADLSLVIPSRNAAQTLPETLDSIAAQTVAPRQVIIVDDASTDATNDIARNHRIGATVMKGEGRGPAAAVNFGARHATGHWLAQLDADDLWPPDRVEHSLKTLSENPADALVGMVQTFPDPGVPAEVIDRIQYQKEPHMGYLPGGVLIRREVFLALGGYDDDRKIAFFLDFWDRFKLAGHTYRTTPGVVLRRRIRPGTLSHRIGEQRKVVDRDTLSAVHQAILRRNKAKP